MGKIILFLIVFIVAMLFFTVHDNSQSGIFVLGLMGGLYLLFWALIIGGVLGILKWLLRGAVKVTKDEWNK